MTTLDLPDSMLADLRIRRVSSEGASSWNSFVSTHPDASICHQFEWTKVFNRAYGKRCRYLVASRGSELVGVLPLVHMRGPLSGNRLVSLPFLDQGGILSNSAEAAVALRDEAFRVAREEQARGISFRGPSGAERESLKEPQRFRFLLELSGSEKDLWNRIGPKVRNQIRKANKCGLSTEVEEFARFDDFFAIFARNMRDLGSPVHARRFFTEIFDSFGSAVQLFVTRDAESSPVAGGVCLRFGSLATVPWASSLRSARSLCPNHSLYWRVLCSARADGLQVFDFGRSCRGTGTYRFKKQWNAAPDALEWRAFDSHGREEQELHLSAARHGLLASLWRRLPVRVATSLGPLIRRHIAN